MDEKNNSMAEPETKPAEEPKAEPETKPVEEPEAEPEKELTEEEIQQIGAWEKRNKWIIFWGFIIAALLFAILADVGG